MPGLLSRFAATVTLAAWFNGPAQAHEHWVSASQLYPGAGAEVEVRLGSGHHFPRSVMALGDAVIARLALTPAGTGEAQPIPSHIEGTQRQGVAPLGDPGVYRLDLALKRPRSEAVVYRARALIIAGNRDEPARYTSGQGLEIVPASGLSALRPGDALDLLLMLDGNAAEGTLSVRDPEGRTRLLGTAPDRPARITALKAGTYFVHSQHTGVGVSLVFAIQGGSVP